MNNTEIIGNEKDEKQKNMTTEEKQKAYDESIKKIKGYTTDEFGYIRLKPSDIFPELAESEDEKIRKEILYVIHQLDDNTTICGRNYDYQKWISWLEKQGEQKPAWSEEDESNIEEAIYYIIREPYRECDVEPIVNWLRTIKERLKGE